MSEKSEHAPLYAVSVIGQSIFKVDTLTGAVYTFVGRPDGMADLDIAPETPPLVDEAVQRDSLIRDAP